MSPRSSGSPRRVFVDTGGWYAYFVETEDQHATASEIVDESSAELVTSSYVFDETVTLVSGRLGHQAAIEVGSRLRDPSIVRTHRITRAEADAAWDRFVQRPGHAYSFTDCTSFAVMDRLGIDHVLTTDQDFRKEGYTDVIGERRRP